MCYKYIQEWRYSIINKFKKVLVGVRTLIKLFVILTVAVLIIIGIINFAYKQTYSVSLNGEIIGYTRDKVNLQKRINDYISSGNGDDVAFVEVKEMPVYTACLLKRNVEVNDDEIFEKVTSSGTPYYKFYAITDENTEKVYVSDFQQAEDVVSQLKDKNSANASDLGIVEKYETAKAEFTEVSACVDQLYEKKVVYYNPYKYIGTQIYSEDSVPTDLGVTLIRPVSGVISSRYGLRSRDNHAGLDIAAPKGTAIKAAAGGTVIFAGNGAGNGYSGYGNVVVVRSNENLIILYGHCSEVNCRTGEQVAQGQVIAKVGSTGISTGNHLHFEIRYAGRTINPQNYVYN